MTEIRRVYKSEEKMKIVMEGLSGTIQISDLCKKYGIGTSRFYTIVLQNDMKTQRI